MMCDAMVELYHSYLGTIQKTTTKLPQSYPKTTPKLPPKPSPRYSMFAIVLLGRKSAFRAGSGIGAGFSVPRFGSRTCRSDGYVFLGAMYP